MSELASQVPVFGVHDVLFPGLDDVSALSAMKESPL